MTAKLSKINFQEVVESYTDNFDLIQVLDKEGNVVDEETLKEFTDEEMVSLMKDIVWGRAVDTRIINLNRQGAIGIYPPFGGQEAAQFGALAAIKKEDFLVPTFRDMVVATKHGLPLYKAFLWYKGNVGGNKLDKDLNMYCSQVMVGGTLTPAAGVAIGKKLNKADTVVLTFCGDGATSQGDFYEGINFAGVFKAPLITVIENNGYGISVPAKHQTAAQTFAQKGIAVGSLSLRVDGMDVLAMYAAVKKAREYAVAGNGPVVIEAVAYRYGAHTMADDPKRYRTDEEVAEWKDKDPLKRLRNYLTQKGLWSPEQEEEIVELAKKDTKEAMTQMANEPVQKVSEAIKDMFEVTPPSLAIQLKKYEAKEME